MGGFVTVVTAARHADRVSGAVICDSPVTEPDPEIGAHQVRQAFGAPRTYPTHDDALGHFRTAPARDHYLDDVVDHVARRSRRPVHGGWRWKFDREVFAQFVGSMRSVAYPYLSSAPGPPSVTPGTSAAARSASQAARTWQPRRWSLTRPRDCMAA